MLLKLLALGFGYFIWLKLTNLAIPCIFRKITGWLCPGCGITTLIMALSRFDFKKAWEANPFLFATGPFLLAECLYELWLKKNNKRSPRWNNILIMLYCIALLIFGILRNII